jgi:hypothetical protein
MFVKEASADHQHSVINFVLCWSMLVVKQSKVSEILDT